VTVLEAISRRRAVRAFDPEPVNPESIRALLATAVRAPTAMHAEPWAFVVVQDRALLKKYSDLAKATWQRESESPRAVAAPHMGPRATRPRSWSSPTSTSSTTPGRSS
jgi:nitroreductase